VRQFEPSCTGSRWAFNRVASTSCTPCDIAGQSCAGKIDGAHRLSEHCGADQLKIFAANVAGIMPSGENCSDEVCQLPLNGVNFPSSSARALLDQARYDASLCIVYRAQQALWATPA